MAEYIERNDLIKNLNYFAIEHYSTLINDLIMKQPTVDVVKVVRCKDCKFRGREDCSMYYRCNCGEQHTWETDNDFCSYGERRKND